MKLLNMIKEMLYPDVVIISIKTITKKCRTEAGEKSKLAGLLSFQVSKFLPT